MEEMITVHMLSLNWFVREELRSSVLFMAQGYGSTLRRRREGCNLAGRREYVATTASASPPPRGIMLEELLSRVSHGGGVRLDLEAGRT